MNRRSSPFLLIKGDFFGKNTENNIMLFSQVYVRYFDLLIVKSLKIVGSRFLAEEVIQDVFLRLWETKDKIHQIDEFESYLCRSVTNESLNKIRNLQTQNKHYNQFSKSLASQFIDLFLEEEELKIKIAKAVETLPRQCKAVFKMNRYGGLKYKQIAEQLNISEKTVEGHITKALKILKRELITFVLCLIWLLL